MRYHELIVETGVKIDQRRFYVECAALLELDISIGDAGRVVELDYLSESHPSGEMKRM